MKAFFQNPTDQQLSEFLEKKQHANFSYSELEGTLQTRTEGYDNDLNSVLLGRGGLVWEKAKSALKNWKQFPPAWTNIYKSNTVLEKNKIVVVQFKLFGIWWLNPAKIVYTFDEPDRFGFAYGTLDGHIEKGEECFWIERNSKGDIYYSIKAFSKPKFWGAKLAYPIARRYQRKFVRESMAEMKRMGDSGT